MKKTKQRLVEAEVKAFAGSEKKAQIEGALRKGNEVHDQLIQASLDWPEKNRTAVKEARSQEDKQV